MDEEIELLKEVSKRLTSAGITYMLTGSMALAFYVTPRMTRDIDLIIHVSTNDTQKLINLFQDDFYIDEASVQTAINSQGMFNIIHNESVIKFDFIVRKNTMYRIKEFERKQTITVEGSEVSIVSPEDLILSKLLWAKQSESELQLRDVKNMITYTKALDTKYLNDYSEELGVKDLLQKVYNDE